MPHQFKYTPFNNRKRRLTPKTAIVWHYNKHENFGSFHEFDIAFSSSLLKSGGKVKNERAAFGRVIPLCGLRSHFTNKNNIFSAYFRSLSGLGSAQKDDAAASAKTPNLKQPKKDAKGLKLFSFSKSHDATNSFIEKLV